MPAEPTIDQVALDAPLTGFGVQQLFESKNYVANIIAPVVKTEKQAGQYFVIDPREGFTDEIEKNMVYGDVAPSVNMVVGTGNYATRLRGKRHLAPDGIVLNADAPVKDKIKMIEPILQNMVIHRELLVRNILLESDNYPGGAAGVHWFAAAVAWDIAGANPKDDIDQAKRVVRLACGLVPNTIIVPPITYDILTSNDELVDLIRYQEGPKYLKEGTLGDRLFRLDLFEAGAVHDRNAPLEAMDLDFIWEDADADAGEDWAWVGYVDPAPTLWSGGFMRQFGWNGNELSPGFIGRARIYRDEAREGSYYEFRSDMDLRLTNNRAGAMITGIRTATS